MKETYKDIPGYEGIYQVSDFGNVKSLSRTVLNRAHNAYQNKLKTIRDGF